MCAQLRRYACGTERADVDAGQDEETPEHECGTDRLVILKKPFDTIEVLQLANALTEKWNLLARARLHTEEMEENVRRRTAELAPDAYEFTTPTRSAARALG